MPGLLKRPPAKHSQTEKQEKWEQQNLKARFATLDMLHLHICGLKLVFERSWEGFLGGSLEVLALQVINVSDERSLEVLGCLR